MGMGDGKYRQLRRDEKLHRVGTARCDVTCMCIRPMSGRSRRCVFVELNFITQDEVLRIHPVHCFQSMVQQATLHIAPFFGRVGRATGQHWQTGSWRYPAPARTLLRVTRSRCHAGRPRNADARLLPGRSALSPALVPLLGAWIVRGSHQEPVLGPLGGRHSPPRFPGCSNAAGRSTKAAPRDEAATLVG